MYLNDVMYLGWYIIVSGVLLFFAYMVGHYRGFEVCKQRTLDEASRLQGIAKTLEDDTAYVRKRNDELDKLDTHLRTVSRRLVNIKDMTSLSNWRVYCSEGVEGKHWYELIATNQLMRPCTLMVVSHDDEEGIHRLHGVCDELNQICDPKRKLKTVTGNGFST